MYKSYSESYAITMIFMMALAFGFHCSFTLHCLFFIRKIRAKKNRETRALLCNFLDHHQLSNIHSTLRPQEQIKKYKDLRRFNPYMEQELY